MSTDNMLSEEDWENLKFDWSSLISPVNYFEGSNVDNSYIFVRMSKASTQVDIDAETKCFSRQAENMKLSSFGFHQNITLPEKGLTFSSHYTSGSTHLFNTDNDESEIMALILLNDGHCVKVLSMPFNGSIPTLIKTLYSNDYTEIVEITVITDIKFKEAFEIRGSCHHCGPDPVATYVDKAKSKFSLKDIL